MKMTSKDGVLLKPNDRLIFGTHCVFLFKDPSKPETSCSIPDTDSEPITWENVQMERSNIEDASNKQAQEEQAKKMEQEAKAKMDQLKKEQEEMRKQMQKEYEEKIKLLQQQADGEAQKKKLDEEMKRKEEERARKIKEEEQKIIRRQQEMSDLESRLGVILPLVNEANLISKELKRDIKFNVKLVKTLPETNADGTLEPPKTEIYIKADNFEEGYYYQWPEAKFQDRCFLMRDLINEYFDT